MYMIVMYRCIDGQMCMIVKYSLFSKVIYRILFSIRYIYFN